VDVLQIYGWRGVRIPRRNLSLRLLKSEIISLDMLQKKSKENFLVLDLQQKDQSLVPVFVKFYST
jgi:hypothetical protein